MILKRTPGEKTFMMFNMLFVSAAALACILPFVNTIAVSLSSNYYADGGMVTFWPRGFTVRSYEYLLGMAPFWNSFGISLKRVGLGIVFNMFLTVITAYPLSKMRDKFPSRRLYIWFFFISMIFTGGLIPNYMLIQDLGLMNTIWSLILPSTVPIGNIILLLNFFRQIPGELEDAALIDGAGHFRTLFRIFVPCSLPALATLTLFCTVGHWNAWFDGLIYMNRMENYPLQSYLRTVIVDVTIMMTTNPNYDALKELSDRTIKNAQIIIATIPVLMVYPLLQKYFITGLTLGSVKG